MITSEKLFTYLRYESNADFWARAKYESKNMTDNDWPLIDELLQGLYLISKGYVSDEYKHRLEHKFLESTADEETREMLREMSFGHRRS